MDQHVEEVRPRLLVSWSCLVSQITYRVLQVDGILFLVSLFYIPHVKTVPAEEAEKVEQGRGGQVYRAHINRSNCVSHHHNVLLHQTISN